MDTIMDIAPRLDPREEHFRIPSPHPGLSLFLRYMAPQGGGVRHVLYVHGGTFPSALSIAHRFDGRSWRDVLCGVFPEKRSSLIRHPGGSRDPFLSRTSSGQMGPGFRRGSGVWCEAST